MDFSTPDMIRNITYLGRYYKDGEIIFSAVMFGGHLGIFTGFKNQAFSLNINQRSSESTPYKVYENIKLIGEGYNEVAWAIRDVLTQCEDYDCALDYLSSSPIIAPTYYILAGVKNDEGAVITRERFEPAAIEVLSETNWYVSITNDDQFAGQCQTRCKVVKENMEELGRENLNVESLMNDVMLRNFTLNEISIYSTISGPSEGLFETIPVKSDFPAMP
eukprot:CAMPEP_0170546808 /NCGR_PEP_ID=MMETSP0211-20121228/5142_1 /TAXON_ID=311385 /ORGANISM="Pseudokeronopsis sp., Strain OXSARD2" /LENGTH=218 /DNA_ID=CAMNT_0010851455 /DNA_START=356 /DNA_END=1012 /DNA_ORIENTATION=+